MEANVNPSHRRLRPEKWEASPDRAGSSHTAEQALWKREWAARDNGLAVPECVTRRQAVVNQARTLLKNNTHENN